MFRTLYSPLVQTASQSENFKHLWKACDYPASLAMLFADIHTEAYQPPPYNGNGRRLSEICHLF